MYGVVYVDVLEEDGVLGGICCCDVFFKLV